MALYEFRRVPGAGTATFATRDISRGEIIMDESWPLLAMSPRSAKNPFEIYNALRAQSEESQEAFMKLTHTNRNLNQGRRKIREMMGQQLIEWTADLEDIAEVAAIYWTNAFDAQKEEFDSAVYNDMSRLNHSCANNCLQQAEADGSQWMRAQRYIKAGEELTCPYIAVTAPYQIRQSLLKHYDFVCKCVLCQMEKYILDHPDVNIWTRGVLTDRAGLQVVMRFLRNWFTWVQERDSEENRIQISEQKGIAYNNAGSMFEIAAALMGHIVQDASLSLDQQRLATTNDETLSLIVGDLRKRSGST
ncbi:hypothetical protein SLS56_006994 [Neofusicoccum ribis]|uniref:SET domain-containing protein n=1 Tax=Neofusicoccum ribis TaxID=45134 RepID=A0ABR3SPP5_9PEZI